MLFAWLTVLLVLVLTAVLARRRHFVVHAIAKASATSTIIALVILRGAGYPGEPLFIAGLGFALVGDIALLWPGHRAFLVGLISFLFTLVLYGLAFSAPLPLAWAQVAYAIVPATLGIAAITRLWPFLGRMRPWATVYSLAMVFMVWRAVSLFDAPQFRVQDWLFILAGAMLFFYGDTLLARRRFAKRPAPYVVELGCYFAAQACLAVGMTAM